MAEHNFSKMCSLISIDLFMFILFLKHLNSAPCINAQVLIDQDFEISVTMVRHLNIYLHYA